MQEWGLDGEQLQDWKAGIGALTELIGSDEIQDEKTDPDIIQEQFMILIECDDEQTQAELLDRFSAEGLKCRALIS